MQKFDDTNEKVRLQALKEYNLQETNFDFSYILESLATICKIPLCNIAVYGDDIIIIASAGIEIKKQDKRYGLCTQYVIQKNEFCEIEDIRAIKEIDDRTHLVEDFDIRFYAGYPLSDPLGINLGVLNVFDNKPRVLTKQQKYFIEKAADLILNLFLQKRQEQRLLHYDNMVKKSKDILGIVRFNGEILKENHSLSKLLEYNDEELLNRDILDFIQPEYLEESKTLFNRLQGEKDPLNYILPLVTKNNEIKWIDWIFTPEPSTELIFFIGRDITAAKEQSVLLEQSEKRFRSFFENSQTLMFIHDMQGDIISVNKLAATLIGIPQEALVGQNLDKFLLPNRQEYLKAYIKKINEDGLANDNAHVIGKDGKKRILLYSSVVEENTTGEPYVLTNAVDLTDHYIMEEDLKIATKKAEEANQAKSEFIANMSHEIRTPLNGIIGFTDLLMKTPLDDMQQQYLKIINQSGTTLHNIVDQILDFSKIESRRITLVKEKIDLQNLASDAWTMVSFASEKKKLEMLLDFQESLPRFIWGDEIRLKQVLVNLLSNAVKFTAEGEIKLIVNLKEKLSDNKIILHFIVSDTGVGIHPDKMDEIFKAFTQEDSSITKRYGGTGLGLTISNRLLELMNSKLEVESEPNKGSCFSFELEVETENEAFDDELLKGIKKVLVVDDNDSNRQILKRMLELKNIEVDEADSGMSALLILQKNADYDVIIMDYHMPMMDGIETIRKIKESIINKSRIEEQPIIMLYSSSDSEKLQAECDNLEIQSRLVKPIKMQELYEVLAKLKNKKTKDKKLNKSNLVKVAYHDNEEYSLMEESFTILIAEDNDINMYLSKILVQQLAPNATVVEARDGEEAVNLFFEKLPDFVLMDIQMPNMNGYEAAKQIRLKENGKSTPIVALTAGNISGEREKCLQAGMNDFMAKPILKKKLADVFKKWLMANETDNKEEIREIAHFNRSWFTQYATDDVAFKGRVVQLAKTGIEESLKALQEGILNRDLDALNATGHKLKGTCLAVGLTQLSKYAVAFESLQEFDEEHIQNLFESVLFESELVNQLLDDE